MNIIVFEGYLGSGKTLGGSIFAKHFEALSGCALYSNYGLVGSKVFDGIEVFKDIAKQDSSIVVLDEAHVDLDARSFSSNHVKFFSQLSFYLRKVRCTLILTSPQFENLDARIRGITNILVHVSSDAKYFKYEMYDVQSRRYLRTMQIEKEKAFLIADNVYDTTKMVLPVKVPAKQDEFKVFLEELKKIAEEESMKRTLLTLNLKK